MGMWANCWVCFFSDSAGQRAECCYVDGARGSLCEVIWLIKQRPTLQQCRSCAAAVPALLWASLCDRCGAGAAGMSLASLSSARPWMNLRSWGRDSVCAGACAAACSVEWQLRLQSGVGGGGCLSCGRQLGWAHLWRRVQLHYRRRAALFLTCALGLDPWVGGRVFEDDATPGSSGSEWPLAVCRPHGACSAARPRPSTVPYGERPSLSWTHASCVH